MLNPILVSFKLDMGIEPQSKLKGEELMKIIFSEPQIKQIIDLYTKENKSTREIGTIFNVSKGVIGRVLKENNIELNHSNRKYYGDYRIFESIDNAEKAYWLGFIAADGCNYWREENASIIISLSRKDRSHLEKFKTFVKTNAIITDFTQSQGFSSSEGTEMSKIVLNSKEMSRDLSDKGIVPRKSLILEPPKIKKEFYLSYILGYFDGDGSIWKSSQYNNYGIGFEGTKETLEWINKVLKMNVSLEKRYDDNKNNYYIRCGGTNKPYTILKQLYNSCETHLDRKYNKFIELEKVVLDRNIK